MNRDEQNLHEEAQLVLNAAMREVIRDLPDLPTQLRIRKRQRFGEALLLLAPFCLSVAFLPWPGKNGLDQVMWLGFAILLLLLGGWQFDKASRDEKKAAQLLGRSEPVRKTRPGKRLWRVK